MLELSSRVLRARSLPAIKPGDPPRVRWRVPFLACLATSMWLTGAWAGDSDHTPPAVAAAAIAGDPTHEGIWKAVVPVPGTMHGQFDNNDPLGLAAGVRVPADCSINWRDPDTHQL